MKKMIFLFISLLLISAQLLPLPKKRVVGISPYIDNGEVIPRFVYDIICLDSTNCVAIADDNSYEINIQAYVIKSTDGGYTWEVIFKFPKYITYAAIFAYPSKNHIYVGTDYGTIFRIYEGGKSFDTTVLLYFDKNPSGPLVRCISMADSLNGIATGETRLWITNDGWKTFRRIYHGWSGLLNGAPQRRCYCFDSLNFLVAFGSKQKDSGANYEGIGRTTDGGKTWHEFITPEYIQTIYFQNRTLGWAVGERRTGIGDQAADIIYKTTDGGFTWTKVLDKEIHPNFGLLDIDFADSLIGCAVGGWGKVLITYNGGRNWLRYPFPETKYDAPTMTCAFAGRNLLIGTFGYGLWLWEDPKILSYSSETTEENTSRVFAYPNPFFENVKIQFNTLVEPPIELRFYDSMGNLIESHRIEYPESEAVFTPTDRSEGVYFYQILTSKGTFTGCIIKVK